MRRIALSIFVLLTSLKVFCQTYTIDDYRKCIDKYGMDAKEYIFSLFKEADIVVLGERDHRDTTQYKFILELLSDPRFARTVGYVYTEVGVNNMTEKVNKLIKGQYVNEQAFTDSLYAYTLNEVFYPVWEKYNRLQFLHGLYEVNRQSKHKITLGLTDCEFSWDTIHTPEQYRKFFYSPACEYRDSTMTANFIQMYNNQRPHKGKRKALIITNHPHAINASIKNRDYSRQGKWLKHHFGEDKVKIVLLNWLDYKNLNNKHTPLVANGLWDAAFELIETKPFGLSIKDTPYGDTPYADKTYGEIKWQDVTDGIIYYTPIYDQRLTIGAKRELVPEDFKEEVFRRQNIYRKAVDSGTPEIPADELQQYYNRFVTFPATYPEEPDSVKIRIQKIVKMNNEIKEKNE